MKLLTYDSAVNNDYYQIIGLTKSAPIGEIKRAVNRMFVAYHPDNGGNRELFQRIIEAKEMLLNPVSRKIYDKTGFSRQEIAKYAKEFVVFLFQFYLAGTTDHKKIVASMRKAYDEEVETAESQRDELEHKLETVRKVIEDIDPNSFFMKDILSQFEQNISDIQNKIFAKEHEIKVLIAKRELVSLLSFKKKTQEDIMQSYGLDFLAQTLGAATKSQDSFMEEGTSFTINMKPSAAKS